MCELGYKSNDFNYSSFIKFADGIQKNKYGKKIIIAEYKENLK